MNNKPKQPTDLDFEKLRRLANNRDFPEVEWLISEIEKLRSENAQYKLWQDKVEGTSTNPLKPTTTMNRRARIAWLERENIRLEKQLATAKKGLEIAQEDLHDEFCGAVCHPFCERAKQTLAAISVGEGDGK